MDPAALDRFAAVAGELPLRVTADGQPVAPLAGGVPGALAGLLGRTVLARIDGTWARLKVCRDLGCREAFYDASRNRSGTWCSMAVCGARAKQRTFVDRRRARSATAGPPPR